MKTRLCIAASLTVLGLGCGQQSQEPAAATPIAAASDQWMTHPWPGIPRTADGKPDLSAPAPHTADGKPDFSGVWGLDAGPSLFWIAGDPKPGYAKPVVAKILAGARRKPRVRRSDRALPAGGSALQPLRRVPQEDRADAGAHHRSRRGPELSADLYGWTSVAEGSEPELHGLLRRTMGRRYARRRLARLQGTHVARLGRTSAQREAASHRALAAAGLRPPGN